MSFADDQSLGMPGEDTNGRANEVVAQAMRFVDDNGMEGEEEGAGGGGYVTAEAGEGAAGAGAAAAAGGLAGAEAAGASAASR